MGIDPSTNRIYVANFSSNTVSVIDGADPANGGAGKVLVTLPGVPEYRQFKINIESAYLAWGRKSPPKEQTHPASEAFATPAARRAQSPA